MKMVGGVTALGVSHGREGLVVVKKAGGMMRAVVL